MSRRLHPGPNTPDGSDAPAHWERFGRDPSAVKRRFYWGCVLLCLIPSMWALAQEGHPLTGTWSGDWGPNFTERNHLTIIMRWEGERISGLINPGPDSIPIESLVLDVTDWKIRWEATTEDARGNPVHIVAEGQLQDLGSPHRMIQGRWRQGEVEGDFSITRD